MDKINDHEDEKPRHLVPNGADKSWKASDFSEDDWVDDDWIKENTREVK